MTDNTRNPKLTNNVNNPAEPPKATDTKSSRGVQSKALPEAKELKDRFKAGSIPLQTDFADLIDMANIGRLSVGGAEGQTGPADGFTLTDSGCLELKPSATGGLGVDKNGIAVKVIPNKGIDVDKDGIAVKVNTDKGIEVDNNGAAVKANTDKGIEVNKDGVAIKVIPNKGIDVNKDGIAVKVNTDKGIEVDNNGAAVKANTDKGIEVNKDGVAVKVNTDKGIEVNKDGVAIKVIPNKGIDVNKDGIAVKVNTDKGIDVDKDGISVKVKLTKGLEMTAAGIAINDGHGLKTRDTTGELDIFVYEKGGIYGGQGGIKVIPGNGIQVNESGVGLKLASKSNLNVDKSDGLALDFPIGFGVLSYTTEDANNKFIGKWSKAGTVLAPALGTFTIWIRIE